MPTHYSPPFPAALWIAAAGAAVVAQAWFWRRTALAGFTKAAVGGVRLAVILLASWLLANPMTPWRGQRQPSRALLLLDASASMDFKGADGLTRAAHAKAVREAVTDDPHLAGRVEAAWFGERLHAGVPPAATDASRKSTRIGAALREALATGGASNLSAAVIVSDGATQDGPAAEAMARIAASRNLPLAVMPVGVTHPVVNAGIAACMVERRAAPNTKLPVSITVQRTNCQDQPVKVALVDRNTQKVIDSLILSSRPGGAEMETAELHLTTGAEPLHVIARIDPVSGEATTADNETSFTVESTEPKIRVLFMEGTEKVNRFGRNEVTMLPDGVRQEDPNIEVDALTLNVTNSVGGSILMRATWNDPGNIRKDSRGFPRTREELFRYDLVICSDIPQVAFTKEQIEWTVELVAERGGGFIMIGGYTSFGTGLWDRTPWEKLIPVDMSYAGAGYLNQGIEVYWTREGRQHPILANLAGKGESLEEILDAHPVLNGTNLIRRAKPAAVTLMRRDSESGQPLITVQNYGKGRTLAFTSDITEGWGAYHSTIWGPSAASVFDQGNVQNLIRTDVQTGRPESGSSVAPQPESNRYYRRFWTSAIHWLTEKSVAQNASRFYGGCLAVTWADDASLDVYAIAADPALSAEISNWRAVAWVKDLPAARTPLRWQTEGNRFTGRIPRPVGLPEGENTIVVEAVSPDQKEKHHSEFSVRVLPCDPEASHPQPEPEVLAGLAAATGAPVLHRSADVAAWLRSRQTAADEKALTDSVPAWNRWPILAAILGLLGLEWLIRRLYS
jgi:uncharacterized membrane protein